VLIGIPVHCNHFQDTVTLLLLLLCYYCPRVLADGNQHIWITEKMLQFSSTVLPAPSPHCTDVQ